LDGVGEGVERVEERVTRVEVAVPAHVPKAVWQEALQWASEVPHQPYYKSQLEVSTRKTKKTYLRTTVTVATTSTSILVGTATRPIRGDSRSRRSHSKGADGKRKEEAHDEQFLLSFNPNSERQTQR
jgi:hypothetical protein